MSRTDAEYVQWLRRQVNGLSPSLDIFFDTLHGMKYYWSNHGDENRALDGLVLRRHWEAEAAPVPHIHGDCTVLEFLVGVSNRLYDLTYDPEIPDQVGNWFWILIDHLGIETIENDCLEIYGVHEVTEALHRFMSHEYAPDGTDGGLFPLMRAPGDQRVVEVWLQMNNYLMEIM